MAAKKKTTTNVKTYTEAEIAAMIAAAKREGVEEGRKAKSDARAARKAALAKPGLTMFPHTAERAERNMLAEGVYVTGEHVIEFSAVQVNHDGVYLPRFRIAVNPIFGVNGDTDTSPAVLVAAVTVKAKHAPEIVAALVQEYAATERKHTYRERSKAKA
jgi:mannose-1-phosphate guanylyltransferase